MTDYSMPCGNQGPYRQGVNTAVGKTKGYLLCNRPAGHDDDGRHIHYSRRVHAKWSTAGEPISVEPSYGVEVRTNAQAG